jgi:hypothetical protein
MTAPDFPSQLEAMADRLEDLGSPIRPSRYELMQAASALLRQAAERERGRWRPTHQHRKGGLYQEIARGHSTDEMPIPIVIYRDERGDWWARAASEFDDGRFTKLPTPPKETT